MIKKIIVLLTLTQGLSAFSFCTDILQQKINSTTIGSTRSRVELIQTDGKYGITLLSVAIPTPKKTIRIGGIPLAIHKVQVRGFKNILRAIEGSYQYIENNQKNRPFKKLVRKINKKREDRLSSLEIAKAIIHSNETNLFCQATDLNVYAGFLANNI